MVADGRLDWTTWRNGGAELLMLRDAYPSVPERVLGAGWRMLEEAGDDPGARSDVLELLSGCEAAARKEASC